MDARMLQPAQFRRLVGKSLEAFLQDWAAARSTNPELVPEALRAEQWLEAFSEFAMEDIVNPRLALAIPERLDTPLRAGRRGR